MIDLMSPLTAAYFLSSAFFIFFILPYTAMPLQTSNRKIHTRHQIIIKCPSPSIQPAYIIPAARIILINQSGTIKRRRHNLLIQATSRIREKFGIAASVVEGGVVGDTPSPFKRDAFAVYGRGMFFDVFLALGSASRDFEDREGDGGVGCQCGGTGLGSG